MNESCPNQDHETPISYWPSVEQTTAAVGKRSPFARGFHGATRPDAPGERPRRTPVGACRPSQGWNPDGAHRQPRLSHRAGRVLACRLRSAQQYHVCLGGGRLGAASSHPARESAGVRKAYQPVDPAPAGRGECRTSDHSSGPQHRVDPAGLPAAGRPVEAGQALDHQSGPPLRTQKKQRDRLMRRALAQANGVLGFADAV